ncbi:MAG: porin [Pseudomonadota bacterium]|nr:porin [Pseudomonadota bacterium]
MKKKLLSLIVAGALAPVVHADVDTDVSGFIDVIYTAIDDAADVAGGDNPSERKFLADGEVDFSAALSDNVTVRVDVNLYLDPATDQDSAEIEQAFFAATLAEPLTLLGGVFNNPIGWEAEDAPDLYQTSHSWNWAMLDNQTALSGNNVAGVALAAALEGVTITGAVLNDLQHEAEENSFALLVNASPIDGLALEAGYVTQEKEGIVNLGAMDLGTGDVLDLNASYTFEGWTIAGEVMLPSELVDQSILLLVNYAIPNTPVAVTARYETISYDVSGVEDPTRFTLAGSYEIAKNLFALLEYANTDEDSPFSNEGDVVTAEFVGLF